MVFRSNIFLVKEKELVIDLDIDMFIRFGIIEFFYESPWKFLLRKFGLPISRYENDGFAKDVYLHYFEIIIFLSNWKSAQMKYVF